MQWPRRRSPGAGIDVDALSTRLQEEGTASFAKSWNELMTVIETKNASLRETG